MAVPVTDAQIFSDRVIKSLVKKGMRNPPIAIEKIFEMIAINHPEIEKVITSNRLNIWSMNLNEYIDAFANAYINLYPYWKGYIGDDSRKFYRRMEKCLNACPQFVNNMFGYTVARAEVAMACRLYVWTEEGLIKQIREALDGNDPLEDYTFLVIRCGYEAVQKYTNFIHQFLEYTRMEDFRKMMSEIETE